MPRTPKPSGSDNLKTGNQFIDHAAKRGAVIRTDRRGGFTEVEGHGGSVYIAPGDQPLDLRTRKNLRHWFRLLGLLVIFPGILLAIVDWMWGYLQLPPIF